MSITNNSVIFQDYLPSKVCFGCGAENEKGLHIKSYWDADIAKCKWQPQPHHEGWMQLTCGGIISTVVDCHCIATSIATAKRDMNIPLQSEPHFVFATGSINIRFLKPASVKKPLELQATVTQIKNERKYTVNCDVYVDGEIIADAQVITLMVYRSDRPEDSPEIFRQTHS